MPSYQGYSWAQVQLDAFWQRYVEMAPVDVVYTCNAEPEFRSMLHYIYFNYLYGFEQRNPATHPAAGHMPFSNSKTVL